MSWYILEQIKASVRNIKTEFISNKNDREFLIDTGYWSKAPNVSILSGSCVVNIATGNANIISRLPSITVGVKYRIMVKIEDYVSGTFNFQNSFSGSPSYSGNGTFVFYGVCSYNNIAVTTYGGFIGKIKYISVKKVI